MTVQPSSTMDRSTLVSIQGTFAWSVTSFRNLSLCSREMSNQHEQPPLHADWKTEPAKHGIRSQIRKSGFVAYIIGTGANEKR